MLYIRDIEKIIQDTLLEANLKLNYEINNDLQAPMSFNVSTNTIKFNYIQVNGFLSRVKVKETKENLVKILVYHEIGYYLDYKKNRYDLRTLMYGEDEEIKQLTAQIETNAWDYGRTLVPEELIDSYDQVRDLEKVHIPNF
ncbi:hypothetical protein M3182_16255 [Mesobacillus maritimus]|uniref:hypothetical protein n=1 Tax=Mesobacillus maritimus TaxID=1643336 RepID=UPI00203B71F6|nr:hypothetical protein [Mesobacillus maritimus]MCM3587291.1 hypothetical protein [Mesobacillus maritimus]MCM3667857.1 hypothetical protein [Mesobacillus maritimus]